MNPASLQSAEELDAWYRSRDPWGYEASPDDERRRANLLSALPPGDFRSVLDVGCGDGFITRHLPGRSVTGVDISPNAIAHAKTLETDRLVFETGDIFNLADRFEGKRFDLIVITGVLYPQYVGAAHTLIYNIIDRLLDSDGMIISVHISEWYRARFPYTLLSMSAYPYRQYFHRLEVYSE